MANLQEKIQCNVHALLAEVKACSRSRDLQRGKRVHAKAVECGHASNIFVASTLIHMYAKCASVADARRVFDSLRNPNVVSWNVLILGYAANGEGLAALHLFRTMRGEGFVPDSVTFVGALKACITLVVKGGGWGKVLHNLAIENSCVSDIFVQNTLIDMYCKCCSMADARRMFDSMKYRDVVSWNVLILGYADIGQGFTAMELFTKMKRENLEPDSVTLVAALKACISLGAATKCCRSLHNLAVENGSDADIYLQSSLIDMYARCSSMVDALLLFTCMKHPDVVSWTVLILGYADNGQGLFALKLFMRMRCEGPPPNSVTFAAVLKACGLVGGLEFGRTIHSEIGRGGRNAEVFLVNCLVDFYAKCCSLVEAQSIFDSYPESRDIVTWTGLLAGFSSCGDHESAFSLLERMQDAGLVPDSVTFLCILKCCSHSGLVEKGKECFDAMPVKYGVVPAVEHYTCMVDIFGRANKLEDAMALLECMPCSPDDVTWRTILGACRKWRNVELGRLAFQSLTNPSDSNYLLMGQIYGSRGMLQEQEMVLRLRKKLHDSEAPGETCWTDELGEVHTFLILLDLRRDAK